MFDSSGNEYEPDYPIDYSYDYEDSDTYTDSPTYQSDPDMEKEPEVAISSDKGVVISLSQQAANVIGARLPYEAVELWGQRLGKKMADEVQLAVMKASFPVDKGLIRRYAYLSRKTGYHKLSDLFQQPTRSTRRTGKFAVEDAMQIGEWLVGTAA